MHDGSTHVLILSALAIAFLAWVLLQYVRFKRDRHDREDRP